MPVARISDVALHGYTATQWDARVATPFAWSAHHKVMPSRQDWCNGARRRLRAWSVQRGIGTRQSRIARFTEQQDQGQSQRQQVGASGAGLQQGKVTGN